jgi:uncharacterized tellurite resistance protein B-like protein
MPGSILASVREFFEGNPSVRRVADDPAISAEILLLFRMILADGSVQEVELATLARICSEAFDIPEDDMPKVLRYLREFGYETSGTQAIEIFRNLPEDRRRLLLKHLVEIARADHALDRHEVRLATSVAQMLDLRIDGDGEVAAPIG